LGARIWERGRLFPKPHLGTQGGPFPKGRLGVFGPERCGLLGSTRFWGKNFYWPKLDYHYLTLGRALETFQNFGALNWSFEIKKPLSSN